MEARRYFRTRFLRFTAHCWEQPQFFLQIRFIENQKSWNLLFSGILSGLALITKLEFGFAILATTIALIFLALPGCKLKTAMLSILPALMIPFLTYATLAFNMPLSMLIKDCFWLPQTIPRELIYFNRIKTGLNDLGRTMTEMAGGTTILVLLAGWIGLISIYLARLKATSPMCRDAGSPGFIP